ncbi:hypothetical protein JXM67_05530 [candidate division WOR-3 bacterium]|nr:hypothetical protein [candidate division WOR-3 bacterium]
MRVFVGILFGVLTALAVVAGIYLWLEMRSEHEGLLEERRELETDIALLKTDLADWTGTPPDVRQLKRELDSLQDTLKFIEPDIEEILSARQALSRDPVLLLAEPHDASPWRFYPFQITIEGKPQAVDSFMNMLQENLPLVHFDRIVGEWSYGNLELEVVGSIRFPLEL